MAKDVPVCSKRSECHLSGCTDEAAYEGWARKIDPFTGQRTGMSIYIPVCEDHKMVLIGHQEGKESTS